MMYALINYGTGEIYSISGEKITCQYLYNRALSQRREALRYGYALDKMHLVKCSDYEHIMNGAVIYIELDTDMKRNNGYVLCPGYVIDDKYKLKQAGVIASGTGSHGNEKLKQEDIDKIITRLVG